MLIGFLRPNFAKPKPKDQSCNEVDFKKNIAENVEKYEKLKLLNEQQPCNEIVQKALKRMSYDCKFLK